MLINANFSSEQELGGTLDFIYAKSKEGGVFHGILEAAFNEVTIVTAIHNIKANRGSRTAGLDQKNIKYYLKLPYETVIELVRKAVEDYKPCPVRRVYIEKSNGKKRPLGIPTMLDRIIQECIRIVIEPIVEAKFYPHSYGFRPERACKHAITVITQAITNGGKTPPVYAIEGDIQSFFDQVNHRILLNKLFKIGIHDKRILAIIKKMLLAGYFEEGKVCQTELGTPQGSILSPLLANVYLNDFDWFVGRMYHQPRYKCKTLKGCRKTLRYNGVIPKFIVRYADDWIILTTTRAEAERMLKALEEYFRHRLKLTLSAEKTKITNLTEQPAKFLQFDIVAEAPLSWVGKTPKRKLVGKNYPDFEKVKNQVRTICDTLATLKNCANEKERSLVIERVNSIIVGVMEYWKTGICSKTYKYIDHKVFQSAMHIFKKLYPVNFREHIKPSNTLTNRPQRHEGYKSMTFAVNVGETWIGITKAALTHSQWGNVPFNQGITPYSEEGRELIRKKKQKSPPQPRHPLYTQDTLEHIIHRKNSISNFEYYMNREYAYNRDRGKCRICGKLLTRQNRVCHRTDPSLPIDKVNKVANLVWIHRTCQSMIKSNESVKLPSRNMRKLEKLREKFNKIP